jgi:hypothetical protein
MKPKIFNQFFEDNAAAVEIPQVPKIQAQIICSRYAEMKLDNASIINKSVEKSKVEQELFLHMTKNQHLLRGFKTMLITRIALLTYEIWFHSVIKNSKIFDRTMGKLRNRFI